MTITTVRYKIAPDKIDENARLIRAVFAQLNETKPEGLYYASMMTEDGSFMHVVHTDDDTPDGILTELPAFKAFTSGLKDRAIEGTAFTDFEVVGNYGIF